MTAAFTAVNTLADKGLIVGLVVARSVSVGPTPAPHVAELERLIAQASGSGEIAGAVSKDAVRDLLRIGGYKPSGRGKPASEYLAQAAREGRFPRINNLVDANNLLSLATGLPISLLDLDAVGPSGALRFGAAGETYVFNAGGQVIDLGGLIVFCGAEALGNPVKDSMAGKLKDDTKSVVGCIYAPSAVVSRAAMQAHLDRFAALLSACGEAPLIETLIV